MHRKITAIFLFLILALANLAPSAMAGGYGFPKKAEDAAAASGDDLCVQGAVIKNANDTALAADGDYTVPTCNDVGNLKIQIEPSRKAAYCAQSDLFSPAASATDFACMAGSGTKTIKILQIKLALYNGATGANNIVHLIRRSTDNSGGTSTSPTTVKCDTSSSSSTCTIRHYTANPSLGTTVGTIATKLVSSLYGSTYANQPIGPEFETIMYDATTGLRPPIVLRGTSEVLTLNAAGVSLSASTGARVTWVWTEE